MRVVCLRAASSVSYEDAESVNDLPANDEKRSVVEKCNYEKFSAVYKLRTAIVYKECLANCPRISASKYLVSVLVISNGTGSLGLLCFYLHVHIFRTAIGIFALI